MKWKLVISALLPLIVCGGCKHFATASYSGPLADFAKKIDPVYSKYADAYQQMQKASASLNAQNSGDAQKVLALAAQIETLTPQIRSAIKNALKTEKGKQIPFTQSGGAEGFTLNKVTFEDAYPIQGDVSLHFEGHATLHSPDVRWKSVKWLFVDKNGATLASDVFTDTSDARSGPVTFYGNVIGLNKLSRNFDHIVIQ